MISLIAFIVFCALFVGFGALGLIVDEKFMRYVKMAACGLIAVAILGFACIIPYTRQLNDFYSIQQSQDNIELYRSYIEHYRDISEQEVEKWLEFRKKSVYNMSPEALKHFQSLSPDSIVEGLTGQIEEFENLILEEELRVHELQRRLAARANNKFLFGVALD